MTAEWKKKLQHRERSRNYRANHPEKIRAANAANNPRREQSQRDPNIEREQRQERYFRTRRDTNTSILLDAIITPNDPRLLWMDEHGNLHREDLRSAEEVIREYERKSP
jgi:hypothetical protein